MKRERTIDLDDEEYSILKRVIESYMPYNEIWAYGSRVKWNASERADLDLVVLGADSSALSDFRDALGESDLLVSVDVMDWENISDDFKENIKKKYVVVQKNTIPKGWGEFKLDDVADIINGGTPRTSNTEYWGGDIAWITPKDLSNRKRILIDKGERNISTAGLDNSSACLLPKGTVLLTSRAPIGYLAVANNPLSTNQGFKGLIVKKDVAHNLFIYYWLKTKVEYLESIGSGSVFSEISASVLKNVSICLPTLPEQKAIAELLSSLDDKIELLHRQNKTLESMAQTLFRKWFIEDDNPDWEKKPLSYFGNVICGKTPSKKIHEYFGGKIPFIKIPDMQSKCFVFDSDDTLTEEGKNSQPNKTIPPKSISVSCIATVGLVSMNAFESQTNQQINSIVPKKEQYRYYIYLYMKFSKSLLDVMASGGTAAPNLNTGNFIKILLPTANNNILQTFHSKVQSMFDKIYANQIQIRTLEKTRDLLLPKLMSGKIKV